jgi:hypothetical protein
MVTIKRSETQGHQWIIELGKVQEGMDSEGVEAKRGKGSEMEVE